MLLHAQRHWPEYITTIIWPFALMAATDRINNLHIDLDGKPPEMKFYSVAGLPTRLKHFILLVVPYMCWMLDCKIQGEEDLRKGVRVQDLAIFRPFSSSYRECCTGTQSKNRIGIPTLSCDHR